MANISQFYGEITFPNECAEELITFLDNYTSPSYQGVMSFNESGGDIRRYIQDNMSLTVGFWGDGRWTASSMFDYDGASFFYPDENPAVQPLIKKLVGYEVPINYVDYEPGCEVLYEFTGEMSVDDSGAVSITGSYEDIDYTSRNLVRYNCEHCAIDGRSEQDFEELVGLVIQELKEKDTALLRQVVRKNLEDMRYDNMLTDMDLEYGFMEDVAVDFEKAKKEFNIYAPSKQSLINFL